MTRKTTCDGPECDTFEREAGNIVWMVLNPGGQHNLHFCDIECLFAWSYVEGGFDKSGVPPRIWQDEQKQRNEAFEALLARSHGEAEGRCADHPQGCIRFDSDGNLAGVPR